VDDSSPLRDAFRAAWKQTAPKPFGYIPATLRAFVADKTGRKA